ncbi:MAG: NADH-quinone oxidoreductase subunit C, partial [Gammaproteobacteria bacterium]
MRAAEAPSARASLCLPSPSRGRRQKSTSTASRRYCAPGAPEDGSGSNAPRHARPARYSPSRCFM